jgi:uncharacterized protein (TIGR02246 family)
MWRFTQLGVCAVVMMLSVSSVSADTVATQPSSTVGAAHRDAAAVEHALHIYAQTFNKHDAAATAALWSPTGAYETQDTGQRLEGREAIQADLADLFRKSPGIQLSIHVDRVHFILPVAARVNGRAIVKVPDEDPQQTCFSAILTQREEQWWLDIAEEAESVPIAMVGAALKDLEWLVGSWRDQSDDIRVDTRIEWAPGGSFLIWAYTIHIKDQDTPQEGTQVIGWDPRSKQLLSWTFESDGSFGVGAWSRNGDEWLARLTYTSATGELATATQVISKINNNQFKAQMVGLEVDGVPMPALEPVTVVRVSTPKPTNGDRR